MTLTLSPRYVNSLTVSTSSYNFLSCSTACRIFPSHFLHVTFLEDYEVIIFTNAHLPWIHLLHCRHKTESAYTRKLQNRNGSTLLLDAPSFVILLLTITLVFQRLAFTNLLSKASFHYKNVFLSPSIVSLIRSKSSAYCYSLSAPSLGNNITTSTTNAKGKGDNTNH